MDTASSLLAAEYSFPNIKRLNYIRTHAWQSVYLLSLSRCAQILSVPGLYITFLQRFGGINTDNAFAEFIIILGLAMQCYKHKQGMQVKHHVPTLTLLLLLLLLLRRSKSMDREKGLTYAEISDQAPQFPCIAYAACSSELSLSQRRGNSCSPAPLTLEANTPFGDAQDRRRRRRRRHGESPTATC